MVALVWLHSKHIQSSTLYERTHERTHEHTHREWTIGCVTNRRGGAGEQSLLDIHKPVHVSRCAAAHDIYNRLKLMLSETHDPYVQPVSYFVLRAVQLILFGVLPGAAMHGSSNGCPLVVRSLPRHL